MSSHQRTLLPKPEGDIGPSSNSSPAPSPSGLKKKRGTAVESACKACRQRRSKCDGQRPACRACSVRNIQCEYEFAPGQTKTIAQKQRVDRAEAENATLLEILWYLKTTPSDEAQKFVEHIKGDDALDVSSMHTWIKKRRPDHSKITFPLSEMRAILSPASSRLIDSEKASSTSSSPEKVDESRSSVTSGKFPARHTAQELDLREAATIATLGAAIEMFFQCTGTLFYVFSQKQAQDTFDEAFGVIENPKETSFFDVLEGGYNTKRGAQYAEICGMAAVGMLYGRVADHEHSPPARLADYLYSTARRMLDRSIQSDPLRAMKVCLLLAEFNIVLKSVVALAYVELGLGMGRNHGLHNDQCPPGIAREDFCDYRRTWRTLVLFSGWLGASLGYIYRPEIQLPDLADDTKPEDLIQAELVKVTIMKANIIRDIPNDRIVDDSTIRNFRRELKLFYEKLPDWMSFKTLSQPDVVKAEPLRKIVYYLHLFYLSAMQLLHRRVIGNLAELATSSEDLTQEKSEAIKEGLMAGKMAARVLNLMRQEGAIVQICWMCIFASFTTGITILQAAIQKVFNGFHHSLWIADLTLVQICIHTLDYCAEIDKIAIRFRDIVQKYLEVIKDAVNGEMNHDASKDIDESESMEYLFNRDGGDSDLHKAASDLFSLVRRPFSNELQLLPDLDWSHRFLHSTLVNWAEAAAGAALEWTWELQASGLHGTEQAADIMADMSPGRFGADGESVWSMWTPPAF